MKKFVCISCGRKWYVDEIDEKAVMSCPYCAKKIIEERLLVINLYVVYVDMFMREILHRTSAHSVMRQQVSLQSRLEIRHGQQSM